MHRAPPSQIYHISAVIFGPSGIRFGLTDIRPYLTVYLGRHSLLMHGERLLSPRQPFRQAFGVAIPMLLKMPQLHPTHSTHTRSYHRPPILSAFVNTASIAYIVNQDFIAPTAGLMSRFNDASISSCTVAQLSTKKHA